MERTLRRALVVPRVYRGAMAEIFSLQFPQSLGTFENYADAQKAVDHLADHDFPVENVLVVGTDLKQVERITGRLTWGRVILAGIASGVWLGLFVGLLLGLFAEPGSWFATVLSAAAFGAVFGAVWAAIGYAFTRGRRDFSSVQQIRPSRYEVLVEHKHLTRAQELLVQLPGYRASEF